MGANDFAKLPHIGESLKRKEDERFLTGNGQYPTTSRRRNRNMRCLSAARTRMPLSKA